MTQAEDIIHARKKACFRTAELIAASFPSVDVDECYKLLYAIMPQTYQEADAEMLIASDKVTPPSKRKSGLAALKEVTGKTDAMDAVWAAVYRLRTEEPNDAK